MFDCLLLMAGTGSRTSLTYNKIKYKINGKPLYLYSLEKFLSLKECNKVIMVVNENEYEEFKDFENDRIIVTIGGSSRSESVLKGALCSKEEIVLIHDAARANVKAEDILNVYYKCLTEKSVCLSVRVKDCIRKSEEFSTVIDRQNLWQAQTPQGVNKKLLIEGLKNGNISYYDDCEVLEKNFGIATSIVEGSYDNIKVTTDEDLKYMEYLLNKNIGSFRIGHSKDTHRLVRNRKLVLGGVYIPFELGLDGHSDADVVYHAVVESIIGALGKGDIGKLFPDKDPKYKNIESSYFMNEIYKIMKEEGYEINNLDVTIYLEKPILKDYKPLMEKNISELLCCDINVVNIKATRGEGIGYIGNLEGASAEAICSLIKRV